MEVMKYVILGGSGKTEILKPVVIGRSSEKNRLYPLQAFRDHPLNWINWMKKEGYVIEDEILASEIKQYFERRESRKSDLLNSIKRL